MVDFIGQELTRNFVGEGSPWISYTNSILVLARFSLVGRVNCDHGLDPTCKRFQRNFFFFSSIFPDILNLSLPLLAMQYTYDDRSEYRAFNLLTIISTRYHSLRSFPREKDYPVFPFFTHPEKEEGGQNTIIQRPLSILFPPFSNLHS